MAKQNQKTEDSECRDLKSIINNFSLRFYNPHTRRKITNDTRKDMDGNITVVKDRLSQLPEVLPQVYLNEVRLRKRPFVPIEKSYVDSVLYFLSDPNAHPWLMLLGTPGTGKSTMMSAIRRTVEFLYQDDYEKPKIISCKASQLGSVMKNDPERFRKMLCAEMLFIDDLGFSGESEMVNDYGVKRRPIETIIEQRYDSQATTIFSTNLTRQMLQERYGERIFSRLCEMCQFIPMVGQDYRQLKK